MKNMANTKKLVTLLVAVLILVSSWSGCKRASTENPIGDRTDASYSDQDFSSASFPEVIPSSMPSVLTSDSNVQTIPSQILPPPTSSMPADAWDASSSLPPREPSSMGDVSSYVLEHGNPSSLDVVSPPPLYWNQEEFLAWAKSDGGNWAGEYNPVFLDWVSVNKRLLLPKMKRDDVTSCEISTTAGSRAGYVYRYDTRDRYTFDAIVFPISEEEKDFEVLAQSFPKRSYKYMKKGSGSCPWGEYWYTDPLYWEDGSTKAIPGAVFFIQGYAVEIQALREGIDMPWNDEYFTYFDFETISW